ncbi:hypothetical protein LOY46_13895 [Pseudomonas sichuanensis]|uniref:hypothetical protein n=1 Tax=Pseudomonas sichuanensis TaxID=2213015 RepID=UPI00215E722B|nr:hypothetical protein [Pseudomonas sichuanensis]UVK80685.1 hypothetical protein LOY46_13895 [Pseudomonas sichuanensis]
MQVEWSAVKDFFWGLLSSPNTPAWIQAVGALVALGVAIYVSRRSIEHAGLLRQKTIFSIAEAASEYAKNIRGAIEYITDEPGSNLILYNVYNRQVTAGYIRALQAAPLHELASGRQVAAILGLTSHLIFLEDQVDKLMVPPSLQPDVAEQLKTMGNNFEARRELLGIAIGVLKGNAFMQLNKIDEHYQELKKSISR